MSAGVPSLAEFQRLMKSCIRPGPAARPAGAQEWLNAQRGTPASERLKVYAEGYLVRMREALEEVYEAVRFVVGEREFGALAQAYAAAHPSHDYSLSLVGRALPEFLAGAPVTRGLPFLPDLARLEWLICQAFHAFEQPPLDRAVLASVPTDQWERLQLGFQPSVGLAASAWPILDIWNARRGPRDTVDLTVADRPQRVLVFRRELSVQCEALDEPQFTLLAALLAGRALGEACGAVRASDPLALTSWFARWMGGGLIVRAELASALA